MATRYLGGSFGFPLEDAYFRGEVARLDVFDPYPQSTDNAEVYYMKRNTPPPVPVEVGDSYEDDPCDGNTSMWPSNFPSQTTLHDRAPIGTTVSAGGLRTCGLRMEFRTEEQGDGSYFVYAKVMSAVMFTGEPLRQRYRPFVLPTSRTVSFSVGLTWLDGSEVEHFGVMDDEFVFAAGIYGYQSYGYPTAWPPEIKIGELPAGTHSIVWGVLTVD